MQPFKYAQLLLKYRPRSEFEIRQRLKQKCCCNIEPIISRLKAAGQIDDLGFAKYWISYRQSFNPKSKFFIEKELLQKGVDSFLIAGAFSACADFDEDKIIINLAKKKIKLLGSGGNYISRKRKLSAFLGRRGFGYSMIRKAADQVLSGEKVED